MSLLSLFHLKYAPPPTTPHTHFSVLPRLSVACWLLLLTIGHWIDIDITVTGKWSEGATSAAPWNVLLKIDSSSVVGLSWVSKTHSTSVMLKHMPLWSWLSWVVWIGPGRCLFLSTMAHCRTVKGYVLRGAILSSTSAVLTGWHHSCSSPGFPTGHSTGSGPIFKHSGNRMTTCFHALQLKWLFWKARMLFRHCLISTVSAQQKISVTLSIFTR